MEFLTAGGDLEAFSARLTSPDFDELALLATGEEGELRDRAHGVLVILHQRRDPRLSAILSSWLDTVAAEYRARRTRPPDVLEERAVFRSRLLVDSELHLPVSDGTALIVARGSLWCRVAVKVVPTDEAALDSSDDIDCEVRVADAMGRVFRAHRRFAAAVLLHLISPAGWTSRVASLRRLAQHVRLFDDSRDNIAALSYLDGIATVPFAYRAKYLYLSCDLFLRPGSMRADPHGMPDRLVVRLCPATRGALPTGPTPAAWFSIEHLPALVISPAAILGFVPSSPVVFEPTDEKSDPEPLVRCADHGHDGAAPSSGRRPA